MGENMEKFEMAHADNPEEMIKATQRAIIASMRDVLSGFKKDIGGPGLTWDQLDYFLSEFEKKEPEIIIQEYET